MPDLVAAIGQWEARHSPRWVWPSTAELYPRLLDRGLRVERCYDMELAEALLLGVEGHWGEPRSLASAAARLHGEPVPPDPPPRSPTEAQDALFSVEAPAPALPRFCRCTSTSAPAARRLRSPVGSTP